MPEDIGELISSMLASVLNQGASVLSSKLNFQKPSSNPQSVNHHHLFGSHGLMKQIPDHVIPDDLYDDLESNHLSSETIGELKDHFARLSSAYEKAADLLLLDFSSQLFRDRAISIHLVLSVNQDIINFMNMQSFAIRKTRDILHHVRISSFVIRNLWYTHHWVLLSVNITGGSAMFGILS